MVAYCICVIISGGTVKIPAHQRLAPRGDLKYGDGKPLERRGSRELIFQEHKFAEVPCMLLLIWSCIHMQQAPAVSCPFQFLSDVESC